MATYNVTTPREKYNVEAKDKDKARKLVIEREDITIAKQSDTTKPFKVIDIRKDLPYQRSVGTMNRGSMNRVIIHHDGQWRPDVYDSLKRYKAQAAYHIGKGYGHIAYHYIIDNVGDVFRCLADDEVAYHSGNWWTNHRSIAIKFDGNMELQKLTSAQIESYKSLMNYLTTQRPDMPRIVKGSEKGHMQIKRTACPGKNTMPIISQY